MGHHSLSAVFTGVVGNIRVMGMSGTNNSREHSPSPALGPYSWSQCRIAFQTRSNIPWV
jgi:hypothetical protein